MRGLADSNQGRTAPTAQEGLRVSRMFLTSVPTDGPA